MAGGGRGNSLRLELYEVEEEHEGVAILSAFEVVAILAEGCCPRLQETPLDHPELLMNDRRLRSTGFGPNPRVRVGSRSLMLWASLVGSKFHRARWRKFSVKSKKAAPRWLQTTFGGPRVST